jgi:predicted Zn-ribbon and HTH transcriptional regulator
MENIIVKSRYENTSNGYVKLWLSDGRVIEEHRFRMEQHLGRRLHRNEVVHHLDGDRKNNAIENLEVVTRSAHRGVHAEGETMIRLACALCGRVFERTAQQVRFKLRHGQVNFYCDRKCMSRKFGGSPPVKIQGT